MKSGPWFLPWWQIVLAVALALAFGLAGDWVRLYVLRALGWL